jgi:hypothetical protein
MKHTIGGLTISVLCKTIFAAGLFTLGAAIIGSAHVEQFIYHIEKERRK